MKLRQAMRQIENELETLQSTNVQSPNEVKINPKTSDMELVPKAPLITKPITPELSLLGINNNNNQIPNQIENGLVSAQWSNFKPWAECFCGRQVRTRICKYDNAYHSSGNYFKIFVLQQT